MFGLAQALHRISRGEWWVCFRAVKHPREWRKSFYIGLIVEWRTIRRRVPLRSKYLSVALSSCRSWMLVLPHPTD